MSEVPLYGERWDAALGLNLQPPLYTLNTTPYTLHPAPSTLHPTPSTLHPTPYTLHPTSQTLYPVPFVLAIHTQYVATRDQR